MRERHSPNFKELRSLHPTLWRTCRVLANPVRLRMLAEVFREPGQCVRDLATLCSIPPDMASRYLRMLQARGLLAAERAGRWIHYYPRADPAVHQASPLLKALRHALVTEEQGLVSMIHILTGFTHERRLVMLGVLSESGMSFADLRAATDISQPALVRHLDKLLRRELVQELGSGEYIVASPKDRLGRVLLELTKGTRAFGEMN